MVMLPFRVRLWSLPQSPQGTQSFSGIHDTFFVYSVIFVVSGKNLYTGIDQLLCLKAHEPVLFIHPVLQLLTHFEEGELFSVHVYTFARLWIPSRVG